MEPGLPFDPPPVEYVLNKIQAGLEEKKRDLREDRYLYKKITNWEGQIDTLQGKIANVKREVVPEITRDLEKPLLEQDDVLAAMVDDTTKNLFLEIGTEYKDGLPGVSFDCLQRMARLPDDIQALTFLGDAALLLGCMPYIWTEERLSKG